MYECPINIMECDCPINIDEIVDKIHREKVESQEKMILESISRIGVNISKEELVKALMYDRGQYRRGYEDRDREIVRCRDCEHHREKPNGYINCVYHLTTVDDDGFCKWGERRQDG